MQHIKIFRFGNTLTHLGHTGADNFEDIVLKQTNSRVGSHLITLVSEANPLNQSKSTKLVYLASGRQPLPCRFRLFYVGPGGLRLG